MLRYSIILVCVCVTRDGCRTLAQQNQQIFDSDLAIAVTVGPLARVQLTLALLTFATLLSALDPARFESTIVATHRCASTIEAAVALDRDTSTCNEI